MTTWDYIKENYHPDDRLAVVIKNASGPVIQRISTAERIASPEFQRWLRFENLRGGNVCVMWNRARFCSFLLTPVKSWLDLYFSSL